MVDKTYTLSELEKLTDDELMIKADALKAASPVTNAFILAYAQRSYEQAKCASKSQTLAAIMMIVVAIGTFIVAVFTAWIAFRSLNS